MEILEHASECTALCGAPQLHLRAGMLQFIQRPFKFRRCLHLCWSASSEALAEPSRGDRMQAPSSTVALDNCQGYTGSIQPASTSQLKYGQLETDALCA